MNSYSKNDMSYEIEKRKEAEKILNEIWYKYDKQNTGILPKEMSLKLLNDIGLYAQDDNFVQNKYQILNFLDADGDGKLSKRELISLLTYGQ